MSFAGLHSYYNTIKGKSKNEGNIPLAYNDKVNTYFIYCRTSIAWLTSYYAPDKNIVVNFTDYGKSNANPFENLTYEDGIPQNNNEPIMLLINKEDSIPDAYYDSYNCQYISSWKTSAQTIDAYMLSKK